MRIRWAVTAAVLAAGVTACATPVLVSAPAAQPQQVSAEPTSWNVPPACMEAIRLSEGFNADLENAFGQRPSDAAFIGYFPVWQRDSQPVVRDAVAQCRALVPHTPPGAPVP